MRCTVCDYSDDTVSTLNDSLTDGNFPRTFKRRNNETICSTCSDYIKDVHVMWQEIEHDDDEESAGFVDPDWDNLGALDKL